MCLQETHAMNQLVLNNRFHGSVVTDECSTGQLGTVILVDKSLDVVAQLGSGSWRLAIVAVKSTLSKSPSVVVVVNIYATYTHSESINFFPDCYVRIEEFVEMLTADLPSPSEIIISGDFNFVFNPISESINRSSSNQERSLANLVTKELISRACIRDPQTLIHPERKNPYTRRCGDCYSTLDHICVASSMVQIISE